ncbi:MAG: TonB-dependent receptor [Bacteroidota bacterium]
MRNFILFLLLISLPTFNILAQKNAGHGVIQGMVKDPQNLPLEYATVSVYDNNEKLAAGTITDEKGAFTIPKLISGTYKIKIEFLGLEKYTRSNIVISQDLKNVDLSSIQLQSNQQQMDAVEITAEKSTYNLQLDKKVFHVGQDVLSQGGNAIEILDQVPLVSVDPAGTVTLRGSSQVQILINGRRSGLTINNAIDQIDGDNIERIEVITNPSSQYDANGSAGIINIILKKNKKGGLKGQVRLNAGTPANHMVIPSMTYKTKNINLFGNLRWRYSDYNGIYSTTQTTFNGEESIALTNDEIEDRHDDGAAVYLGGDYYFNDNNSITLAYYRNETKDADFTTLDYLFDSEEITREGNSVENRNYNQIEANYTKTIPNSSTKWTIDFQYDFWNSEKDWTLATDGESLPAQVASSLRTNNISRSRDYVLQTDFVKPLDEKSKIETGAKIENRIVINDYIAEQEIENGQWSVFEGINNEFEYAELISAAYVQLERSFKKFEIQVGARGEFTQIDIGDINKLFSDKKEYFNLFPTAFISYQLNEGNTIQGSYSRRINRPWLWDIYPFSEITDFNRQRIGNPDLDPSFTHGIEFSYLNVQDKLTINPTIFYKRISNDFSTFLFQSDSGTFFLLPINIDRNTEAGLDISVRYRPISFLNVDTEFSYYTFNEKGRYNDTDLSAKGSTWRIRANVNFRLPSNTRLQLRYLFVGPRKGVQIDYFSSSDLTIGINKDFFNDKINVSLRGANILDTRKWRSKSESDEYIIEQSDRRTGPRYTVSVLYKFNQTAKDRMRSANRGNR